MGLSQAHGPFLKSMGPLMGPGVIVPLAPLSVALFDALAYKKENKEQQCRAPWKDYKF